MSTATSRLLRWSALVCVGLAAVLFLILFALRCTVTRQDYDPLIYAASIGDAEQVKVLLLDGHDPIVRQKRMRQHTPLIASIFYGATGHVGVVHILIEHGADPNVCDVDGLSALYWAVVRLDVSSVDYLLVHGADLRGPPGKTPLDCAKARHQRHPVNGKQILELLAGARDEKGQPVGSTERQGPSQ